LIFDEVGRRAINGPGQAVHLVGMTVGPGPNRAAIGNQDRRFRLCALGAA
jgi:hypothetical protein